MTTLARTGLGVIGLLVVIGIMGAAFDSLEPTPVVENTTEKNIVQAEPVETSTETVGQVEGALEEALGTEAKVVRVIDGDTFEIEGGQTIRLITTDTPETVHPTHPVECMGKEASAKTKELIEGKTVRLEKDVSETDRYGRLLRYVYLEDGRLLNELLIQEGFANAVSYPPDVRHLEKLRTAEASAKNNKWGLWSSQCYEPVVQRNTSTQTAPVKSTTPAPKTTTQAALKPVATIAPEAGGNCGSDSYNCGDFSSCSEVMTVFNACDGDPHGLDGDDDGIPCESLCG